MIEISIIIVNYNTKELLNQCLKSVFEKTQNIDFEVIVVDNASQDYSCEMIKNEFANVKLIENTENLGFGKANNLGAKIAQGKYLFFLNSDTVLINNAVKILFDFMEKNQNCGICGGNLFDKKNTPVQSFQPVLPSILWELNAFTPKNLLYKLIFGKSYEFNHSQQPKEVGYIIGADMMVRKEILDKFGGFDNDFFMFFEETEMAHRFNKNGYKIVSVPQSKIIHFEGQSIDNNLVRQKYFLSSRSKFYLKIYNKFYLFCANIIFSLSSLIRIFIFAILLRFSKVRFWHFSLKNVWKK